MWRNTPKKWGELCLQKPKTGPKQVKKGLILGGTYVFGPIYSVVKEQGYELLDTLNLHFTIFNDLTKISLASPDAWPERVLPGNG